MGCGRSRVAPAYAVNGVPVELKKRRQNIFDPAERAVTLKQLQRLAQFVKQALSDGVLCDTNPKSPSYGHRLAWDTVTVGQIHAHFLAPLTDKEKCSYVEIVSKRPERSPEWCVSHAWDERFRDLIAVISQHAKSHNSAACAYWISAFSLNCEEVEDANKAVLASANVEKLPFTQALRHFDCAGVLSLVGDSGSALQRSWVLLERHIASRYPGKKLDIGVVVKDDKRGDTWIEGGPVLLLDQGKGGAGPWKEVGKAEHLAWPLEVASALTRVRVADSAAVSEASKQGILHILARSDASEVPPERCAAYDELDQRVRSCFYARAMCHAILHGDEHRLLELLQDSDVALNEVVPYYGAPIHVAAEHNSKNCTKALLDVRANASLHRLEDGSTPAFLACTRNSSACLRLLLDEHVDPNKGRKQDKASPLHAAYEATPCIQVLLAARAEPNWPKTNGATPLHLAAEFNAIDSVHTLIHGKADPNHRMIHDNVGATPVHLATMHNHYICLSVLLGAKGDANQALPDTAKTPIHISLENDNKACLKTLLEARADPERPRSHDGHRAVHVAVEKDSPSCLKLLLDARCDPNVPIPADGTTPLCWVARDGRLACLRLLVHAKGSVNHQCHQGWAPLDYAEKYGNRDLAVALRDSGGQAFRPPSPDRHGNARKSTVHSIASRRPSEFQPRRSTVQSHSGSLLSSTGSMEGGPRGIKVNIIHARGVRFSDIGGKSDPYVVCEVCFRKGTHSRFQTKVIKGTVSPEWNHEEHIPDFCEGDSLKFELWDKDMFPKPDDFLGAARIKSDEFLPHGWEGDLRLYKTRSLKGKSDGTLKIRVMPLTPHGQ